MKISVIIPCYNEEKTIIKVLNRLSETKKQDFVYEVIVINDGSTDNSLSLLEQNKDLYDQLITYEKNRDYPFISNGTSRLSVHLRFGTLSIRSLVRVALNSSDSGAKIWLSELIWRDFYQMILDQLKKTIN